MKAKVRIVAAFCGIVGLVVPCLRGQEGMLRSGVVRRIKIADPVREIGGTNYFVENLLNLAPNPSRPRIWSMLMVEVLSLEGSDLICENPIGHKTIILRNYPKAETTPTGTKFSTEAAKVGTEKRTNRNDKVTVVDVWDYGTPVKPEDLKRNSKKKEDSKENP